MTHDPTSETLDELLAHHNPHHTAFQMDRLITIRSSSGTLYGAYRQALRELAARRDAREEAEEAIGLLELDAREHEEQSREAETTGTVAGDRHEALARQARRRVARQRERLEHVKRELRHFAGQVGTLKERLAGADLEALDRELWQATFRLRAAMELRFAGTLTMGTVEAILALPDAMRVSIFAELPELAQSFDRTAALPDPPELRLEGAHGP